MGELISEGSVAVTVLHELGGIRTAHYDTRLEAAEGLAFDLDEHSLARLAERIAKELERRRCECPCGAEVVASDVAAGIRFCRECQVLRGDGD